MESVQRDQISGHTSTELVPTTAAEAGTGPARVHDTLTMKGRAEPRLVALDGLRGVMTIFVLVSHYFAEIPNGATALSLGWIAVLVFFSLSGFLVGRLILDKADRSNFLTVFYVRRVCRTLPVYVVCVLLVFGAIQLFGDQPWAHYTYNGQSFPLWSYLAFWQNFFIVSENTIGHHWLGPTWTLTVEEHFYLIAPALLILTPRRHLLKVLIGGAFASVLFRAYVCYGTNLNVMWVLVTLPGRADALFCGIAAAVVHRDNAVHWRHYDTALRIAPLALLLAAIMIRVVDGANGHLFTVLGFFLVSLASAVYMLAVVRGAPEGLRLHSNALRFFGDNSYSIYLTHVGVLGLMHGLVLGTTPDIATPVQILVTLAAIPIAIFVGWALTRLVEAPLTAYGRSWIWSETRRPG